MDDKVLLDNIEISARATNCLRNEGFIDADDVVDVAKIRARSDLELLRVPNLGRRTLRELRDIFGDHDPPPPPTAEELFFSALKTEQSQFFSKLQTELLQFKSEIRSFVNNEAATIRSLAIDLVQLRNVNTALYERMSMIHNVLAVKMVTDLSDEDLMAELRRRNAVARELQSAIEAKAA